MKLQCAKQSITTIIETASEKLLKYNRFLSDLTRSYRYADSFHIFSQIHSSHSLRPDHYTLSTVLTACSKLQHTSFGSQLHAHAVRAGFKAYPHVSNTLLSLYAKAEDLDSTMRVFGEIETPDLYSWTTLLSACAKSGHVEYACKMFDEMPKRNVECWNAIITGCTERGNEWVAISMFNEMHRMGIRHDNYTFASVLSLCGLDVIDFGGQVHSLVIKTGFLCRASVVNALITMYFNCGDVRNAYEVFEGGETEVYDQITFNVMIDGLVNTGRDNEALLMFREMQEAFFNPTELTFVSVMSSCSYILIANQVHLHVIKLGFETYTSVSNAAIMMYSSCGDYQAAYMIFDKLEEKDLVSWNTMISGYAQGNFSSSAVFAFVQMQRTGIEPDEFTFGSLLASSKFTQVVEMTQAFVSKNGLILKTEILNALVSAYSKHLNINQAYQIFHGIDFKNLISWNSIISGFLLNGLPMQGLEQFSELLISQLKPNLYTLSIVLSACASISALRIGKQVHGYILRSEVFSEISLGNALITMYAKCGVLDCSVRVFNVMVNRDTVSWNSLISAYAQHGQGQEAVQCFELMNRYCSIVKPDRATFTAVLSACSHSGLVDDASKIFHLMVKNYGLIPGVDQLSCIVDLLGRAGYLDEAEGMLESKKFESHSNIWWTLFSACAAHGNLRLGRIVAEFLLETEHYNPSVYVLLSNVYATVGQWEEAANMRKLMKKTGVLKQPGCSWIG